MENPPPQFPQQNVPTQYPQQNIPVQYPPQQYFPQIQHGQPVIYQQPMMGFNGVPPPYYIAQPIGNQQINYGSTHPHGSLIKKTGIQKLEEQSGLFIKQKLELLEVVTGCETENKYHVYPLRKDGATKKPSLLFKCKEKSGVCARQCLKGDCRPFKMNISTIVKGDEDSEYEPFLHLERPCKFTCCCCQRPELLVTLVESGRNEYLGKVVDPFNWCDMEFDVYDKDNVCKYVIEGSCCQLGVWCRYPCDPCQTIDFQIKSPSGEILSLLQKRSAGCVKAAVSDVDSFTVNFPENITAVDKALLMSAVLLLDFRHFEAHPGNR